MSVKQDELLTLPSWSLQQKILLYFFSAYFLLLIIPIDYKFYVYLTSNRFTELNYAVLFELAHYIPRYFGEYPSYLDWVFTAILAGIIASVVLYLERKGKLVIPHNHLYFLVRVIIRYRLAIGLFAYGFIKLFPLQSPYPSISNLNTAYGDLTDWKMFSMSLGIVPGYQSFLGAVEVLAGILLLWRKTASIGAFFVIVFTGNVFMSNLAYGGGEHVYSLFLISLAAFVFVDDLKRLADLTSFDKTAFPTLYRPDFIKGPIKTGRYIIKSLLIFLFVGLYSFQIAVDYQSKNIYHFPIIPGLKEAAGFYHVSTFVINSDTLPQSRTDTVRWKDVVFETWNTISIRSQKQITVDTNRYEHVTINEADRKYESEETSGRLYYSYTIDSASQSLKLTNKNPYYSSDSLVLHYEHLADKSIILKGQNSSNDSLYVVLKYLPKKYLLQEAFKTGRRKGLKI